MVSYSCFLNLFHVRSAGGVGKRKGPCPLFIPRDKDLVIIKLSAVPLSLVRCAPSHGLPTKPCLITAAAGAAYKGLTPVGQAAPGGFLPRNTDCLAPNGSSLNRGDRVVLFPIHAFVDVNYTINRADVNRQFVT